MQYKALHFEIYEEHIGFFGGKTIPREEKLKQMEDKLNELAKDGWRVHQMSSHDSLYSGGQNNGCSASHSYTVLVIMEKE